MQDRRQQEARGGKTYTVRVSDLWMCSTSCGLSVVSIASALRLPWRFLAVSLRLSSFGFFLRVQEKKIQNSFWMTKRLYAKVQGSAASAA